MLNKKILAGGGAGEEAPHVKLTVGEKSVTGGSSYGWSSSKSSNYGSISRIPVWGATRLLYLSTDKNSTKCGVAGQELNISIRRLDTGYEIKIALKNIGGGFATGYTTGSLFAITDNGKTVPLVFTPPLQDISKKVKQVFTRSRKEGVVNAWEGNAYRVGYTRKGKYQQQHGLHCTGGPRWKISLDYTSWQERGGQRTYRGCGISIFPRLGWRLTRACHLGHIEKYITHWLCRFPSKAPNGGLIRRDRCNLGVTSQLEVPYAA